MPGRLLRAGGAAACLAAGGWLGLGAPAGATAPAQTCGPVGGLGGCPTTSTTAAPPTTPTTTTPPTTAGPATTAPPTTTAPPAPLTAALVPCGSDPGTTECRQEPAQVQVTFSAGTAPGPLQLTWVPPPSRPAHAPSPDFTSAILQPGRTVTCQGSPPSGGAEQACWDWPASMTSSSVVLNGTYQVTVCDPARPPTAFSCSEAPGNTPVQLHLAAPPAPPRTVTASVDGPVVTVDWGPSAAPEPDLAGYVVYRNSTAFYACGLAGYTATVPACTNPLRTVDNPGGGRFTYAVSAVRLGDGSGQYTLALSPLSAPSQAVSVAGPAAPSSQPGHGLRLPGAGAGVVLPQVPVVGAVRGLLVGPTTPAPGTGLAGEGGDGSGGPVQNLVYPSAGPDNPVLGRPATLSLETAPGRRSVAPAAAIALALLILALAAHVIYLRAELLARAPFNSGGPGFAKGKVG